MYLFEMYRDIDEMLVLQDFSKISMFLKMLSKHSVKSVRSETFHQRGVGGAGSNLPDKKCESFLKSRSHGTRGNKGS